MRKINTVYSKLEIYLGYKENFKHEFINGNEYFVLHRISCIAEWSGAYPEVDDHRVGEDILFQLLTIQLVNTNCGGALREIKQCT